MRLWILSLLCLLPTTVWAAAPQNDLTRVESFLHQQFPGKSWDRGPEELKSDALRAAYPGLRFFAVSSNEPLPPGAPPPPEQRPTWGERIEQWHATHVTAVVAMNAKGKLSVHGDPNRGLKRVRTESDARNACAAVLSLAKGTRAPPSVVEPSAVTIEREGKGWNCSMSQQFVAGNALITAKGRIENVSKTSTAPLPPSAPPMRR